MTHEESPKVINSNKINNLFIFNKSVQENLKTHQSLNPLSQNPNPENHN